MFFFHFICHNLHFIAFYIHTPPAEDLVNPREWVPQKVMEIPCEEVDGGPNRGKFQGKGTFWIKFQGYSILP